MAALAVDIKGLTNIAGRKTRTKNKELKDCITDLHCSSQDSQKGSEARKGFGGVKDVGLSGDQVVEIRVLGDQDWGVGGYLVPPAPVVNDQMLPVVIAPLAAIPSIRQ